MNQTGKDRSKATLVVIGAIVVALVLIGIWSDGFGLFGSEIAPGTTTPPNNPT